MATDGTPSSSLMGTLNRLEKRLENIQSCFVDLDEAARALNEKLEWHRRVLAKQSQQDQVYDSLRQHSMSPAEVTLLFGYVFETLQCCHKLVLESLPDLAAGLPTIASVVRRRTKNRRVDVACSTALRTLGLGESHAKALCTFFVTQGHQCEYQRTDRRPGDKEAVEEVIWRCVSNQVLKEGLLKSVQVVENGKTNYVNVSDESVSIREMMKRLKDTEP